MTMQIQCGKYAWDRWDRNCTDSHTVGYPQDRWDRSSADSRTTSYPQDGQDRKTTTLSDSEGAARDRRDRQTQSCPAFCPGPKGGVASKVKPCWTDRTDSSLLNDYDYKTHITRARAYARKRGMYRASCPTVPAVPNVVSKARAAGRIVAAKHGTESGQKRNICPNASYAGRMAYKARGGDQDWGSARISTRNIHLCRDYAERRARP